MGYLILSVPLSYQVSKRESRAAFCIAAFLWNLLFFKYFIFSYVSVYAMYFDCKCNVSKIVALVVTLKESLCMCLCYL